MALAAALIGGVAGCGGRSGLFALDAEGLVPEGGPPPVDGSFIDAPAPPACTVSSARVFVTSSLYDASFGGTLGADAACTASANAQKLGGRWRAWLSDSMTPAPARIYAAPGGYLLLDGTLVAGSMGALLSGALAHAIDRTEQNEPISDGNTEVWTGIDVTGFMQSAGYCASTSDADWSSSDEGAPTPLVGHANATDSTWTAAYLQFCNRTNVRLYCFEVCE
jgi:hypothetical protein